MKQHHTSLVLLVVSFIVTCLVLPSSSEVNFLVVGDWGGQNNPYGGHQAEEQRAVAERMGIVGEKYNVSFVLNVGDNFYPAGVKSDTDTLWEEDFKKVYTAKSLQVPWYSTLGNHDYGGNVTAEVVYTGDKRWIMPSRYYSREITITKTGEKATLIVIDSNPISYSCPSRDPRDCKGGDPNSVTFWTNILSQTWKPQMDWLEATLKASKNDWVVIAGHHPSYWIDEYSDPSIAGVFDKYKVAAYYCGHIHDMEHFLVDSYTTDYFISGAGSLASGFTPQAGIEPVVHLETEIDLNEKKRNVWEIKDEWKSTKAGFALVTFDDTATTMKTTFYDYEGTALSSVTTRRPVRSV